MMNPTRPEAPDPQCLRTAPADTPGRHRAKELFAEVLTVILSFVALALLLAGLTYSLSALLP